MLLSAAHAPISSNPVSGPDVGYMLGLRANSCQPTSGYRREPTLDRVSVGRVSSPKNTEKRQVNRELAKAIVLAPPPLR